MKAPLKRHFSWLDALLRAVGYSPTVMLRWNIFWDRRGIVWCEAQQKTECHQAYGNPGASSDTEADAWRQRTAAGKSPSQMG